MPLWHCDKCHHEYEGQGGVCDWCGASGHILTKTTPLEDMCKAVREAGGFKEYVAQQGKWRCSACGRLNSMEHDNVCWHCLEVALEQDAETTAMCAVTCKDTQQMADKLTATELTEARELAAWAGRRIPNGPTSGALMHGYNIGGTADLDAAIAMIVRRALKETKP